MSSHTPAHSATAHQDRFADMICTIMVLVRGTLASGKPFWAYMCIKPSYAKAFRDARERGALDIEDYGTVVEWGEGKDPPAEMRMQMRNKYGMRDDFEDLLIRAIENAEA